MKQSSRALSHFTDSLIATPREASGGLHRSSYIPVIPLEQSSVTMEPGPSLTLANIPLDLQITICMFLHPSDILALRKVCHQSTLNILVV